MTTTHRLHEALDNHKLGSISGFPDFDGEHFNCIVEPTNDLVKVTVLRQTHPHDIGKTYDVLHADIKGLGLVTFYACSVVALIGYFGFASNPTLTLRPSMMSMGHDTIESLQAITYAQVHFPLLSRKALPATLEAKLDAGVEQLADAEKQIYSSDDLKIWLKRASRTHYGRNEWSFHSAKLVEETRLELKFSRPKPLRQVREAVLRTCQLLACFFTREFRASSELYDFPGRPEHHNASALYDRYFHINLWSPIREHYAFDENSSLQQFQGAFDRLSRWTAQYPHLIDCVWHAAVHARSIKRVAVDSFLSASQVAEELQCVLADEGVINEPYKGSAFRNLLVQVHKARPFKILGLKSPTDFFASLQDTRNLYAHGLSRPRKLALYGYDVNLAALSLHLHFFCVLGELLGFAPKTLYKSRDKALAVAHERYLSHMRLNAPLGPLSRKCGWWFG